MGKSSMLMLGFKSFNFVSFSVRLVLLVINVLPQGLATPEAISTVNTAGEGITLCPTPSPARICWGTVLQSPPGHSRPSPYELQQQYLKVSSQRSVFGPGRGKRMSVS
jgi:hypothetical protein